MMAGPVDADQAIGTSGHTRLPALIYHGAIAAAPARRLLPENSMKFSHTIEVNNPHTPQLVPLTRQQLWLGLVLRAESPKLFMPHLDQCDLFDPTDSAVSRELRYGDLVIRDRVTFHPLEQVHYAVPAQGELTTASSLLMRIEEEQPGALSVRFEYDDGQDAPADATNEMYNEYRRSAYLAADNDTIDIIRILAAQGELTEPLG